MSRKTIDINPALFQVGGSRTKKNRDKHKLTKKPLISPNILKNKLLKRIKEYKNKETSNLVNNKKKLTGSGDSNNETNILSNTSIDAYTDEFNDSINYLQTLSTQKKTNDEKMNYEINKQARKEELERKTLKNYNSLISNSSNIPLVNIDLPEELIEPSIIHGSQPITLTTKKDDVPYGVLKGGMKPTYRTWNRTQRNFVVTNPQSAVIIEKNLISEREKRLNQLKNKIKQKQVDTQNDIMMTQNLIQKPSIIESQSLLSSAPLSIKEPNIIPNIIQNVEISNPLQVQIPQNQPQGAFKRITKRTIRKKYTLGKSNIKRTIGVLLKDRATRKKVLSAHKDLKKNSINDVKTYLRNHNLIKIGSNAPNDVVRKLYESAMLAGEITNINTETLLHNFMKDDKDL
jgi:hypothetical protein